MAGGGFRQGRPHGHVPGRPHGVRHGLRPRCRLELRPEPRASAQVDAASLRVDGPFTREPILEDLNNDGYDDLILYAKLSDAPAPTADLRRLRPQAPSIPVGEDPGPRRPLPARDARVGVAGTHDDEDLRRHRRQSQGPMDLLRDLPGGDLKVDDGVEHRPGAVPERRGARERDGPGRLRSGTVDPAGGDPNQLAGRGGAGGRNSTATGPRGAGCGPGSSTGRVGRSGS